MVEEYDDDLFRRPKPPKGGRLHKGVVLHHTRTPSAIPSKAEIEGPPVAHSRSPPENHKSTREGFAVRSRREDPFAQTRDSLQTPGPGAYKHGETPPESAEASTSKKGLGGFASATKRFPIAAPATKNSPGPGQYYDPKKDSSIHLDEPKIIPNYSQFLPEHEPSPGPGSYSPHDIHYADPNKQGSAAFLESGQRVDVLPKTAHESRKLGPGKYNPKPTSDYKKQSVASPFKSDVERRLDDFLGESDTPGPGTYESISSYEKRNPPSRHAIKPTTQGKIQNPTRPPSPDPDEDIQQKPKSKQNSPGPGQYLPLFPDPHITNPSPSAPPHIRRRSVPNTPGSSFASRTHRHELKVVSSAPNTLGPGVYHEEPQLIKQSFNTNRKENWV